MCNLKHPSIHLPYLPTQHHVTVKASPGGSVHRAEGTQDWLPVHHTLTPAITHCGRVGAAIHRTPHDTGTTWKLYIHTDEGGN